MKDNFYYNKGKINRDGEFFLEKNGELNPQLCCKMDRFCNFNCVRFYIDNAGFHVDNPGKDTAYMIVCDTVIIAKELIWG